ncbi:MAG: DUF4440 domain-containing protein [Bacteroidetes bacterium]|nr:DUF4440 domain-containing protein [Bacteroidota bacterium]
MKTKTILFQAAIILINIMVIQSCCSNNKTNKTEIAQEIINMEKTALDRWGKGDPYGYLDIFSTEVTYFNPFEEHRIDSLIAMMKYYGDQAGQIFIDEYKMIDPIVQIHGNTAILTYHLFNYKKQPNGTMKETTRWNSTKVYLLEKDKWKIIHNHWSFLQPDIKASASLQD